MRYLCMSSFLFIHLFKCWLFTVSIAFDFLFFLLFSLSKSSFCHRCLKLLDFLFSIFCLFTFLLTLLQFFCFCMFTFFSVFFHKKRYPCLFSFSGVFGHSPFLLSFLNICFSFFLFFNCPFWMYLFFGDFLWFDCCPFFILSSYIFLAKNRTTTFVFELFQFLLSPLLKKNGISLLFLLFIFQKESPLSQTVTTVASPWQHTWMNPMLFGRVGGERCFRCGEPKLSARRHPISRTRNQDRQGWWRHLAVARKRANRRRARTDPLWSPGRSRTASLRERRRRRTLWTCASRRTWLGFIKLSRHAPCLLPRRRLSRSSLFRCQEHGVRREKWTVLEFPWVSRRSVFLSAVPHEFPSSRRWSKNSPSISVELWTSAWRLDWKPPSLPYRGTHPVFASDHLECTVWGVEHGLFQNFHGSCCSYRRFRANSHREDEESAEASACGDGRRCHDEAQPCPWGWRCHWRRAFNGLETADGVMMQLSTKKGQTYADNQRCVLIHVLVGGSTRLHQAEDDPRILQQTCDSRRDRYDWRRRFTDAEFAAVGRHSRVNGFGDGWWSHRHHSHEEETDFHDVCWRVFSLRSSRASVRWRKES